MVDSRQLTATSLALHRTCNARNLGPRRASPIPKTLTMTDERRYQEEEVAEIFKAASTPAPPNDRAAASLDGLTLAELQAIGQEVGVAPERIADAAHQLDRRGSSAPQRRELGMPISVNRTFDLPRAPTDREWEIIVADLRATFGARGKISSEGDLRDWRNSNLHAYIEPAGDGYRLRMGTLKGNAVMTNWVGAGMLVVGLLIQMVELLTAGGIVEDQVMWVVLGAMILAFNAIRLPMWANERGEQMEYIGARAQTLLSNAE